MAMSISQHLETGRVETTRSVGIFLRLESVGHVSGRCLWSCATIRSMGERPRKASVFREMCAYVCVDSSFWVNLVRLPPKMRETLHIIPFTGFFLHDVWIQSPWLPVVVVFFFCRIRLRIPSGATFGEVQVPVPKLGAAPGPLTQISAFRGGLAFLHGIPTHGDSNSGLGMGD